MADEHAPSARSEKQAVNTRRTVPHRLRNAPVYLTQVHRGGGGNQLQSLQYLRQPIFCRRRGNHIRHSTDIGMSVAHGYT